MRYALSWPERFPAREPRFDVADYARLTFEPPDTETFPALNLGFEAARRGGTAGAALNAADEMAVERFLKGALPFSGIAPVCADTLKNHPFRPDPSLDDLLRADVIQALMCYDELDFDTFDRNHDVAIRDYFGPEIKRLQPLADDELIQLDEDRIRITPKGRLLLRNIAMTFDRYLGRGENDNRFSRAI